jgi:orotidine-5'-phosphate decarboxylase
VTAACRICGQLLHGLPGSAAEFELPGDSTERAFKALAHQAAAHVLAAHAYVWPQFTPMVQAALDLLSSLVLMPVAEPPHDGGFAYCQQRLRDELVHMAQAAEGYKPEVVVVTPADLQALRGGAP